MNKFFIVGVQRSGTTLLAELLSRHRDVLMEKRSIAFRMITCIKNFYDVLPQNLAIEENQFLRWLIKTDSDGRLAQLINPELVSANSTLKQTIERSIQSKLETEQKLIWGDKSPNLQHFIQDMECLIPGAKYIHIYRDGRATANSMHQRARTDIKLAAQSWVDGNAYGIVNQKLLGQEQYFMVKYEDLIVNPERTLRQICEFLKLEFDPGMLLTTEPKAEENTKYVSSFMDREKIDAWQKTLTKQQIRRIEQIQSPLLKKFNYTLTQSLKKESVKMLSLRQKLWLSQVDNFKDLFVKKKKGMKDRMIVDLNIPFKKRVHHLLMRLTRDFTSLDIFKALFPRSFIKQKQYPTDLNESH